MKIIIDRFEGGFAIVELEDKRIINMPQEYTKERPRRRRSLD